MRHAGQFILRRHSAQALARKLRGAGFQAHARPAEGGRDSETEWFVVCPVAGYQQPKGIYELRSEIAALVPERHVGAFPNTPEGAVVEVST